MRHLLILVLSLLAFIFWSFLVHIHIFDSWDQAIYLFFSTFKAPSWIYLNRFFTLFGEWQVLIGFAFLGLVFLLFKRRVKLAIWFPLSIYLALCMTVYLKLFFGKERPPMLHGLSPLESLTYPSGHALVSLFTYGFALSLIDRLTKKRPPWMVWSVSFFIFLIGFSRISLGYHWFSDVVGGYLAGLAWLLFNTFYIKHEKKI